MRATKMRATYFRNLSNEDKTFFRKVYLDKSLQYHKRISKLKRHFKIADERTVRKWANALNITSDAEPIEYTEAKKRQFNKSKKRFIITWAQNNTPVHEGFFDNIKAYAKYIDADIHVILGRYKNPTSVWTKNNEKEEFWDKAVLPFADANRHNIHKYLAILSDVKIQPTAVNPISGLESMTGLNSCIIGSPKVQFKPVPVLEGYRQKLIMTTGAVTKSNYTDSKSGKKGDFHHVFGFVVIEIKDKETFFLRQVTADKDGSFNDLFFNVKDEKIKRIKNIDVAVLGDKHIGLHCPVVESQQRKWLKVLKPKYTVVHDVMDGYSMNPHEEKDPITLYNREKAGQNDVQKEIDCMLDWIDSMKEFNLVIPSANHNDFIDRWVKRVDWKKNIKNADVYMEFTKALLDGKAPDGLVNYFINKRFGKTVKTLGRNTSFIINGWELSQHFDVGANGTKGSIEGFRRMNIKMIGGHSHSPSRTDGVVYVGTSTILRHGYNIGASSWMNADVIVHADKKVQHIIYLGDKKEFTTFKF